DAWNSDAVLSGNRTRRFRGKHLFLFVIRLWCHSGHMLILNLDNLRNDTKYITAWSNAGFTNQFVSHINLLYMASLADRVPIIPPFYPDHHISHDQAVLPFGAVFDLDALRRHMRMPILEWRDIKPINAADFPTDSEQDLPVESIGCWSTRPHNAPDPIQAHVLMHHLRLEASYTRVPQWTHRVPSDESDMHTVVWPLVQLIWHGRGPSKDGEREHVWWGAYSGAHIPPDPHVACFDFLYNVAAGTHDFEWNYAYSPAWRFVAQHLPFSQLSKDRARRYARKAFRLEPGAPLPPYIAVHIRRGDFGRSCEEQGLDSAAVCFAPLSMYERQVQEVRQELLERHGLDVELVILSSDEEDPTFWDEVKALGWSFIDHEAEQTRGKYGEWWSIAIDVAIQANADGFVGTDQSTVSLVSARRVAQWNRGATRMVKW
ncbi:hypothetical protein FISHEDRAFT_44056, partial [Fistulina hepatica ATCC 64428]